MAPAPKKPPKRLLSIQHNGLGPDLTHQHTLSLRTQVAGNVRFVQEYIKSTLLEDLRRYKKELLKEMREGA